MCVAMSVRNFKPDCQCEHCMEFKEVKSTCPDTGTVSIEKVRVPGTGKFHLFNRRASRAGALCRAFGFSRSEAYDVVEASPDVQAFFADLTDGFTEQVYPYPCCDKCQLCADVVRARRKSHFKRQAELFIQLLRHHQIKVCMITLTCPAICPRPEHLADFHDEAARAAFREELIDERVDRRLESVLRTLEKYNGQLPAGDQRFAGAVSERVFEETWDEETAFELRDNKSTGELAWARQYDEFARYQDSPRLRVSLARIIASEARLRDRLDDLDDRLRELEVAGKVGSPSFRDVRNSIYVVLKELKTIPRARVLLKRFLRQDIETELARDDSAVFARWCVHAWQRGWLQAVCGPGRNARPGTPSFFIPRIKRGRGFSYEASVLSGRVHPYLRNLRWHRRHGDVLSPEVESEVFRAPRELVIHLFQGFKKRLQQDGHPFDYLGVEELGKPKPDTKSGSHFHLHLLVGIEADNLRQFRAYLQRVWHQQSGNVYWGRHDARGLSVDFCKPLMSDARTVNYIANYFSKSYEPGHIRKSRGLGLNQCLLEQRVIDINPALSHKVEPVFGRNERGRPTVIPRLKESVLEQFQFEEWVGIAFEERPIGFEPIAAHRATSSPARSVHKAAAVALPGEAAIPPAFWVPAHVWDARGSPTSPASQRICDANESFGWSVFDVLS